MKRLIETKKEKKILLFFYFLLPFLFLHYGFKLVAEEPYPSIVYPAFPGIKNAADSTILNANVIRTHFKNGNTIDLPSSFVGTNIPKSKHNFIVNRLFNIPKNTSQTKEALPKNNVILRLYKIREHFAESHTSKEISEESIQFLKQQIETVTTRTDLESIELIQQNKLYIHSKMVFIPLPDSTLKRITF